MRRQKGSRARRWEGKGLQEGEGTRMEGQDGARACALVHLVPSHPYTLAPSHPCVHPHPFMPSCALAPYESPGETFTT